jgi:pyruvate formate lyase activating enzyme
MGVEAGLWYVYIGNVPGHDGENTYCHHWGSLLIKRYVFDILENHDLSFLFVICVASSP